MGTEEMSEPDSGDRQSDVRVWDLPTRIFHWLLALTLIGSWITHELGLKWMEWHITLGYTALFLVLFRVLWGLAGPRHARFSSFVAGPRRVWRYTRAWWAGQPPRFAGHNPLGGWAVLAMLALVLVQGVSGLFNSDEILYSGPWHYAAPSALTDRMAALHEQNFNFLAGLVLLHVVAVASYWFRWRTNLVKAMWTGRKPAGDVATSEAITGSRLLLALLLVLIAGAVVWVVVAAAPEPPPDTLFF
jgi:cytochrome b